LLIGGAYLALLEIYLMKMFSLIDCIFGMIVDVFTNLIARKTGANLALLLIYIFDANVLPD
jgi:hypothetical protein